MVRTSFPPERHLRIHVQNYVLGSIERAGRAEADPISDSMSLEQYRRDLLYVFRRLVATVVSMPYGGIPLDSGTIVDQEELRRFIQAALDHLPEGCPFDPEYLQELHRDLQFLRIMRPSRTMPSAIHANRLNPYLL